ncbi:hypothetical protein O0L34_g14420 [Tuta absoluta]|nr:hypothetical protein O0L34_g14420 [Tuta absoluta]
MLVEVVTILSLSIKMCMGYIIPNGDQELHRYASKSVVRSVPISYQYNAYHPAPSYQKDKKAPYGYPERHTPMPTKLKSIQYAPLLNHGRIQLQNTNPNKVLYDQRTTIKYKNNIEKSYDVKKHLEPRLEEMPSSLATTSSLQQKTYPLTHLDYIPGKNVQVLRSINRISGHNAVYRNFADEKLGEADKARPINHQNNFIVELDRTTKFCNNPDHITFNPRNIGTTPRSTTSVESLLVSFHQPKHYHIPRPITYIVEKQVSPERTQLTRMRSLLLNVARYNMGIAPHRSFHSDAKSALMEHPNHPNLDHHQLINVPGSADIDIPVTEHNTFLYPIAKNVLFSTD